MGTVNRRAPQVGGCGRRGTDCSHILAFAVLSVIFLILAEQLRGNHVWGPGVARSGKAGS